MPLTADDRTRYYTGFSRLPDGIYLLLGQNTAIPTALLSTLPTIIPASTPPLNRGNLMACRTQS